MADYQKMYAVLCCAVDDAISDLERIPAADLVLRRLQKALFEAENIYIETYHCLTSQE